MKKSSLNSKPGPQRIWLPTTLMVSLLLLAFLSFGSPASLAANKVRVFHGNVKTKKFHKSDCRYFKCKNCLKIFATRAQALKAGYKPCKVCKP